MSVIKSEDLKAGVDLLSEEVNINGITKALKTLVSLNPELSALVGVIAAMSVAFAAMQYNSFDGFYDRAIKDQEALAKTRDDLENTKTLIEENSNKIKELDLQKPDDAIASALDDSSIARIKRRLVDIKEEMGKVAEEYNSKINGNLDYNNRPYIEPLKMAEAGWTEFADNFKDDIATTFDSIVTIGSEDHLMTLAITPILEDGTVLSPEGLDNYIGKLMDASNIDEVLKLDDQNLVMNIVDGDYNEEYWNNFESNILDAKNRHLELFTEANQLQNELSSASISNLDSEIEKLQQQNVVLEKQLELQQSLKQAAQENAATSAKNALTQTDIYDDVIFNSETGTYENKRNRRSILDNVRNDQNRVNEINEALKRNAESISKIDSSTEAGRQKIKVLQDERTRLNSALIDTQTRINQQKDTIVNLYNALFDTDGKILPGYENLVKEVQDIFPDLISSAEEATSAVEDAMTPRISASNLDSTKQAIANAIKTQNDLTAAIASGNSATGMTFEQMQNVIEAFKEIEDFDMATLFEETATGVQMNTEAFKEYNEKLQLKEQAALMDAIIAKTEEYNAALKSQNADEISRTRDELIKLQLMLSEYEASVSKYNAYITATSSANPRDSYSNIVTGYKSVGELIKQGWVTDDSVISYLKLVRGDNWNVDETTGKILSTKEAYDKLSKTIEGTSGSLKDYLTTDSKGNLTSQGVWRFAEDAVKLGFGTKGEDGLLTLDLTDGKLEQIAKRFGTTTDVIELFGKALSDAGMNVTFEPIAKQIENIDKKAADLKEQIKNATDENEALKLMEELNSIESKQIRLRINAALNDGGKSISELLSLSDADLVTELKIDDSQVAQARQMLEELGRSTGEIPLNVKIDEGQLQAILGSLTGTVKVEPEASGEPEFKDATVDVKPNIVEQPKFSPQSVNVSGFSGTSGKFGSSTPGNVNVSGKLNLKLGSYPRTAPPINGTANYSGKFPTSAPTLYGKAIYTAEVKNPPSGGGAVTVSTGTMTSVARADGTAYNVLNYKRLSPSHAGGKVALDTDEYALTNEIGRESIVRDGVWYMLPPGPHMEHLRKGDIVFSAKQTEDLLKAGRTSTYAKALSAGTINALANGSIHAYSGYTGSGYNPWASAGGGYKGGSASTIGSGASSSGGGGSNTSSKDDEHKIDWIEVAIKRFEALLKKLASIAENTFNNLITRLDATTENIVSTSKDIDLQSKAYDRYIKEANSIGLSAGIAEKIRNGEIDINSYDEATRKKIDEYKKWYEKADDCATAIEELKTQLGELYKNKFDYIQKDYENRLELMQERAKKLDNDLKRLDAQGYKADASIYEEQVKDNAKRAEIMKSQLADMQKAFDDLNASGFLQEGSEAWYEMMLEIQKVKNEIDDTDIEIIQLNNTIRKLKWDSFDSALSLISDLNDEADFLIDLLEDGKMTDDAGNLTEDAMAVLGMHAQKMDTFIGKSQRYAEEIARLDKEISKDPLNNTLIERRKELLKLQRESILAANDEKAAMKDLVSEGIDAQLEAVKKLIDAYSDSLDSAKDLYDYQKKIAEKSDAVSEIEKQLAAYQGDTSQETRATIQKLQEDLKKANEDLQDTEYDRYVSDTKKLLDDFYSDYEDVMNSKLDDVDALVEELIGAVNSNAESILNTIREATDQVGIGISDEITGIWGGDSPDWGIISSNSDLITEKMSSVLEAVNAIYRNTCLMSGESATMSFASGGLVDYTGKANVHGTKSKPELMLNAGDTKNFLELRDILRKMPQIDLSMRTFAMKVDTSVPEIASILNAAGNGGYTFGDINIEIDHVENYDDFVSQLQRDKKFEGMIQAMTVGRLSGKSPLDKYSYSWKN